MTQFEFHLVEQVVEGKRLGRHIRHDARSLSYLVPEATVPVSARWQRQIPVLDQGNLGSCTGNATVGVLGTDPFYATLAQPLDEALAVSIYSAAEVLDGGAGYPPEDEGSSGLSVAKVAKTRGFIAGYQHITSVAAAQLAIQAGPFIIGSNWYQGFDNPDDAGHVSISGSVRGGHEYEAIAYNAASDTWELVNSWGTSYGVDGHFFFTSATFARLLTDGGDATSFVPINKPAPVPTPPPPPAPVPVPTPPPAPASDADQILAQAVLSSGWLEHRHIGAAKVVAHALQTWLDSR